MQESLITVFLEMEETLWQKTNNILPEEAMEALSI
jgi:hypothetical protein